ncbi:hypothetical protein [Bacillus solitudinis]|uniref:hypothetical protein n=1 Tax=Bacillus solitudinis TaxID=2014074 RepID=UPI0012FD5202|nr:hypothetical protein [Bacillus solitudinis]
MRNLYRAHFLGIELCVSFVIIGLTIFSLDKWGSYSLIQTNLNEIRDVFYGTLAALSGALLGFVITGLSVLLTSSSNEQIERLRKSKQYKVVFKVFFSTSKYLGILLLTSLICLVFDKDSNPMIWLTFACLWSLMIVTFRLLRCIWVLERIVQLHIIRK